MIVVVFVNEHDSKISVLGRSLLTLLDRTYYVFSRDPDSPYPYCEIKKTLPKLKEIASHIQEDRMIVCFGCRVFPGNIKKIEEIARRISGNVVLLKRLKGSKTWTLSPLRFVNERIADCGIFILTKEDLLKSTEDNFNDFIERLAQQNLLKYELVDFWVFSSPRTQK